MDSMMVPPDRHAAHVYLAEKITMPGDDRDFQWRMFQQHGSEFAAVRLKEEPVEVPSIGDDVAFEIESIALVRTRGKRRYLLDKASRLQFITGTLYTNAGLLVSPDSVRIFDAPGMINQNGSRFVKPAAVFTGQAQVTDALLLAAALKNGIGQGKAYGYGMLIVKEV